MPQSAEAVFIHRLLKKALPRLRGQCLHFPLYFCRVASPPRMWRSALFISRIFLARSYSSRSMCSKRSEISLCTVLFEMPNFFAADRTVVLLSITYAARAHARSSMSVRNLTTPTKVSVYHIYERMARRYAENITKRGKGVKMMLTRGGKDAII